MSKMDALRAMREARYAETTARAAKAAAAKPAAAKPAVAPAAKPATKAATREAAKPADSPDPESTPGTEELCGHRNMGGRTCTREKAHAAKSHRYS